MINNRRKNNGKPGLWRDNWTEVHAELSTKTKIFCSCPTEFGADPNTHVCPVCMAMPGALPVLNEKVVEYAVKAGLATNCSISQDSKNDRKNYAIRLSDEYIENIRKELPEMPESRVTLIWKR